MGLGKNIFYLMTSFKAGFSLYRERFATVQCYIKQVIRHCVELLATVVRGDRCHTLV